MYLNDPNIFSFPQTENYILNNGSSDWDQYLKSQLGNLCKLETNWDGCKCPPVTFENANAAFKLLSGLKDRLSHSRANLQDLISSPPFLIPVSGGALQAEWHEGSFVVELFFDSPEEVTLHTYSEETEWEKEGVINTNSEQYDLSEIVSCFRIIKTENDSVNARAAAAV